MRNRLFFTLFFIGIYFANNANSDAQQSKQPRSAETDIDQIMQRYKSFDFDEDGTAEINELSYLDFETQNHSPQSSKESEKLVLVLVEDRLLDKINGSNLSVKDLEKRLKR